MSGTTAEGAVQAVMPLSAVDMTTLMASQKVYSNRNAVNWLVGIGIFLLVLGIILQVVIGEWCYAGVWILGLILIIVAAIVHCVGASDRDCLYNPANRLCQTSLMRE